MIDEDSLRERQAAILPHLDERQRRLFAAAEAKAAGYGGIAAVSRTTRIAASTIGRGLKDLARPPPGRVRRSGGGRKSLVAANPRLLEDLNALVEPGARGDPMSPLRWTCKSLRRLAAELKKLGHQISHTVVGELLKRQKFSLQANSKTREGADNPDRDAQFQFINDAVEAALVENQPVISVDTKKKELVGDSRPPRPAARTSPAANNRRRRSSGFEPTSFQRRRIACVSIMPTGILPSDQPRNPAAPSQITAGSQPTNRFNCFRGGPYRISVRLEIVCSGPLGHFHFRLGFEWIRPGTGNNSAARMPTTGIDASSSQPTVKEENQSTRYPNTRKAENAPMKPSVL